MRGVVAVLALIVLAACSRETPVAPEPPRPLRTLVLHAQQINLVGEFPGQVQPRVESGLGFQVAGRIVARSVQLGQRVKRGDILARIDPADLRLAENSARAQLSAAEVDRKQAQADLVRYRELRDRGFISAAEFERRQATVDAAIARSAQATAGLDAQRNQSAYTSLKATADGVVTGIDAEAGQVVSAGQVVVRIAETADKEIAFQIPENRLAQIQAIGTGEVQLWSGGAPLRGNLREVSPSADPATRSFAARLSLPQAPADLGFGMTATVRFSARNAQPASRIPLSALLRAEDQTWVWTLDGKDMSVHRRPVRVATVGDTDVVLAEALPDGIEIATAGVHLLHEGQVVRRLSSATQDANAPAAPAASLMPPAGNAAAAAPATAP
ncbi:efflux RND transporter periplasmic adaptor subunit [Pigmentiphaga aceris]|uniref:efflux RND transporter periplasmic adaptor subunit n=1 Tax=Pigmentiphaga aceris TaxID=1940612 RepID=UPI0016522934|nr:efflux RND transporter periplasmic adaptor subunit [Pigmentiphaga aceris]